MVTDQTSPDIVDGLKTEPTCAGAGFSLETPGFFLFCFVFLHLIFFFLLLWLSPKADPKQHMYC